MFAEYAIQVDRARGGFEASVGCEYVDYICDSRIVCIVYPDKKLHGIVCVAKQWLQFVEQFLVGDAGVLQCWL